MFVRFLKGLMSVSVSVSVSVAAVAVQNSYAGGDAQAGQQKAAMCLGCHGADGNSLVPTFPKLAGLGEKYLLKQMQDIRDGRRPVAVMAGQVDNMTDQAVSYTHLTLPTIALV